MITKLGEAPLPISNNHVLNNNGVFFDLPLYQPNSLASYNYDYILFILAYEMTELYQGKTKSEHNRIKVL